MEAKVKHFSNDISTLNSMEARKTELKNHINDMQYQVAYEKVIKNESTCIKLATQQTINKELLDVLKIVMKNQTQADQLQQQFHFSNQNSNQNAYGYENSPNKEDTSALPREDCMQMNPSNYYQNQLQQIDSTIPSQKPINSLKEHSNNFTQKNFQQNYKYDTLLTQSTQVPLNNLNKGSVTDVGITSTNINLGTFTSTGEIASEMIKSRQFDSNKGNNHKDYYSSVNMENKSHQHDVDANHRYSGININH